MGPFIKYKGWGCPGKFYGALYGGGVVVAIIMFVIKTIFTCPAVDIRLIALIAMPVLMYISTEFQWKRNVDSTLRIWMIRNWSGLVRRT